MMLWNWLSKRKVNWPKTQNSPRNPTSELRVIIISLSPYLHSFFAFFFFTFHIWDLLSFLSSPSSTGQNIELKYNFTYLYSSEHICMFITECWCWILVERNAKPIWYFTLIRDLVFLLGNRKFPLIPVSHNITRICHAVNLDQFFLAISFLTV